MTNTVTIKIKNPLAQMFCRHDFRHFETPIDRNSNPYGFTVLNDNGIWVCTKCGKRERD